MKLYQSITRYTKTNMKELTKIKKIITEGLEFEIVLQFK